jgi:hypothetical protein
VQCRIVAADPVGNTLDWSWSFTVLHTYNIELVDGWNLISLPLVQTSDSLDDIFTSIDGIWDMVHVFDSQDPTNPWKTYATFKPDILNTLETVDHTMGIWLHVNNQTILTVYGTPPETTQINLWAGWNLVGYPASEGINLTVLDLKILTGADEVEGFDPATEYRTIALPDEYVLELGEGYWIRTPADTVWDM